MGIFKRKSSFYNLTILTDLEQLINKKCAEFLTTETQFVDLVKEMGPIGGIKDGDSLRYRNSSIEIWENLKMGLLASIEKIEDTIQTIKKSRDYGSSG